MTERYAVRNGLVTRIDETACERHSINRYIVKEHLNAPMIEHLEDEEVILVWSTDGPFPKNIVSEVFDLRRA